MTSMELFPPSEHEPAVPANWGTGCQRGEERGNIWTPKPPTWHYSGLPIEQNYTASNLGLSNVRMTDQLIPNPEHGDVSQAMIDLPFPAEHPYSSHIPRKAIFPNFDSPDDPLTGEEAKLRKPKNPHIPANAYDVIVLHKIKGSGARHEVQYLQPESLKKPLHWLDHDFDHVQKHPDTPKQTYYPVPKTLLNPNSERRSDFKCLRGNMTVCHRTADTAHNVERDQWTTTYDRNYTGMGPSNPYELDNFQDKIETDDDDQGLYARTVPTFDPPRPVEGRISRALVPPPPPQTNMFPEHQKDSTYQRKLTVTEREEDRLLNGGRIVNLPDDVQTQPLYQNGSQNLPDGLQTETLYRSQIPQLDTGGYRVETERPGDHDTPKNDYVEELARQQHDAHQQMEASNRWQLLESQKAHHNIGARDRKMELASTKQQPAVFYTHEGSFQRERAGLYNTTYDPYKLEYSMNKTEKTGPRLMDYTGYQKGSLDLPTELNQEMATVIQSNRTLGNPGSVPQLHRQPTQYETFGPFDVAKSLQTESVQPTVQTSDVLTQEGRLISMESTHGDSYNTKKFLQENQLPLHSRNEPLVLMSNENPNLGNVRLIATPKPTEGRPINAAEDLLTGDPLPGGNWMTRPSYEMSRPSTAPELGSNGRYSYSSENLTTRDSQQNQLSLPVPLERSRIQSRYGIGEQFLSKSSNFMPADVGSSWMQKSAYESQVDPGRKPLADLTFKNDSRFNWKSGCGTPRPQTSLLDIQNGFSKTETKRRFHLMFPENGIDLRDNITSGKRHDFNGINAQVFRGTTVVD